ncbi:hypothetical protein [Denitromonas sp.]|uniref:hypothetical protein n=1 Tax=Denitromonas sp. TaxID=2734609 RepID=UPI002AFEB495|nr:hypothetical protein [Denitromonas sp.]
MERLFERMAAPKLTTELDKHLNSVHAELRQMEYSFSKGDLLRVSNALLASGRMSDTLSRQIFLKELAGWTDELNASDPVEITEMLANFQYIVEREYDKSRFEANLYSILSDAEKGFNPREGIARQLRELADEVESGGYATLLQPKPKRHGEVGVAID